MDKTTVPSLEHFLAGPIDDVRAVAPASVALAIGGTRRSAALAGLTPSSEEYISWIHQRMMGCLALLFHYGVKNIFTIAIRATQSAETGRYRERLIAWTDWGLAGPEVLDYYAQHAWRVRIIGSESIPELRPAAERLIAATPPHWEHTVWWLVSNDLESTWSESLATALKSGVRSQRELVRAQFGEDIPLVEMLISSGKPLFASDIIPPVLVGDLDCYWLQCPGYSLDDATLRRIFYDHAYLRDVEAGGCQDHDPIIGLGKRVGGFWYPHI